MKTICEIVREAESNYVGNSIKLGEYVDFDMHDTIEQIDAYSNSKHINGETDSLGREKPFFDIVTAATNIWYRATDLDRKNIRFIPENEKAVVLAFIANVLLQNWMNDNKFGVFLNKWGRTLAKYGSAVLKFVEKDSKLTPSVIAWNRFIPDQIDFDSIPKIEKFYKTPEQLRKIEGYSQDVVDNLITAINNRKLLNGQSKDNNNNYIELYEVHGLLDSRLLEDEPDWSKTKIKYEQQMHVVCFVADDKEGYKDFTLYKGRESQDPYMITHLIEEDGRTLAKGAVEYSLQGQWMVNHNVKNIKDTLDLASKLIFQTADKKYVGRNVLNAIETGDIFIHDDNRPLTRIANDKPDITASQNFATMWRANNQEITNTPDLVRGVTQAQPVTYGLGQIMNENSNSLFELMTENKALDLEEILKKYVVKHLKKMAKDKKTILGMLDDAGINEIDSMYVPREAVKRYNKKAVDEIIRTQGEGQIPAFNPQVEQQAVKQDLATMGNKRFFVPSEMDDVSWDDLFADFRWDSLRVEITNENKDKQAALTTLAQVFHDVLQFGPRLEQDENAKMILGNILRETSVISPLQLKSGGIPQPTINPTATNNVGSNGGGL